MISTFVISAGDGDTLAFWKNRWLVCPISPGSAGGGDLLLWFPEAWYERAGALTRADTIALFRHNYARDFKLLNRDTFTSSLEAAARGDSLAVYSRLAVTGPGGKELDRFEFDDRFTADEGFLYETPGGAVAIIETDGGYANSDFFYLLFDQPELVEGEAVIVTDSDDIEGNYRGFFTVALEPGKSLWYRRLGVTSQRSHLVDLDRDGIDEILLEAYCAENGVSGGGTTDAGTTYALCLDQGGNIIWRKRLLGIHLGVQAAAVNVTGDEDLEVLIVWSSGYDEQMGGVAVLSADGKTLVERTDLGGLYALAVADFDGDGEVEMATSGPNSRIYILDASLNVEHTRVDSTDLLMPAQLPYAEYAPNGFYDSGLIWRSRVMPVAASDLDGDGVSDLIALHTTWHRWDMPGVGVVLCGRGDIVVLDGELNEIMRAPVDCRTTDGGTYPLDMPASMKLESFPLDIDGDGEDELIIGTKGQGLFAYRGTNGG